MAAEAGPRPAGDPKEPASRVPRWIVLTAALAVAGVVGLIVYGYVARPGWIGVSGKKFWDYLELLIVPAALAIGVYLLNRAQERERQAQEAHRESEREAEAEQREREREATEEARRKGERLAQAAQRERELEIEQQRAQDAALQAYLDQMNLLLLQYDLRTSDVNSEVRRLARARTLTVLMRLDPSRRAEVLQFLVESELVQRVGPANPIIDLSGASLSGIDLSAAKLGGRVNLIGANLSKADLTDANLNQANLSNALLTLADLNRANLSEAYLMKARLARANLNKANLRDAFLNEAILSNSKLIEADLRGVSLIGAELTRTDLRRANVTEEQVFEANDLQGATLPNGQKYEDWLNDQ